jgi:hypothetical protein
MPYTPIYPFNAINDDGTTEVIGPGQVYADDHSYVRRYPELFRDVASEVIEQATSAPGEVRRGPGRPRKEIADL